jgi:hypothetical protein
MKTLTETPPASADANLLLYRFPFRKRMGEYENEFTVEVRAADLRTAILEAVYQATCADGNEDRERQERGYLEESLGADWTPEGFFARSPDLWRGDWLVTIYTPDVMAPDAEPREIMRRWLARQNDPGALTDALESVLSSLKNDDIQSIFFQELHRQRQHEGGKADG